jgi:hypothetical protein
MIRIMLFAQSWFLLASWLCLMIDSLRRSSFVIAFYNPFPTLLFYVMWELISSCQKNIPTYEVITRLNESVLVQSQCVACLKQVACGSRVQAGEEVIYVPNCRDSASWMTSTISAHLFKFTSYWLSLNRSAFGNSVGRIYIPESSECFSTKFDILSISR